jgi:hypothetical protein
MVMPESTSKGYKTKNFVKRFFDIKPEHDEILNKIRNHSLGKGIMVSRSEIVRRALSKYFEKII